MEEIKKAKSFAPTQAMKNNASRGLALREKFNRGGLDASQANAEGVGSGVARARDIINGNLSLDTVKRMYSFFSRHEKNYAPKKKMPDGGPTAGTIAWLLWGGSAGLAFARRILKQEEILKSYRRDITDAEVNQEDNLSWMKLQVSKATNEELMQVMYVAMLPDEVDLHGDVTTVDEVRKACHNFNAFCMKANLFHLVETDSFSIVESFIAPTNFVLGEKLVKAGTWLVNLQIMDSEVWELVKSGKINGVSIGALASVQNLEEDTNE
jgi:hypothetical protein